MKKIILIIFIFLSVCTSAYAQSDDFDYVLQDIMDEYGVYYGDEGVCYAGLWSFQKKDSLFIAYIKNNAINCAVFDNNEGIQCTDKMSFNYGGKNKYKLSIAKKNDDTYVVFETNKIAEYFKIENDAFTKTEAVKYDDITDICGYEKNKTTAYSNSPEKLYYFLNSLKDKRIDNYSFMDKLNTVSDTDKIHDFIASCADLMDFDIKNYDFDTVMKYVLNTHENFKLLCDIPTRTVKGGEDNISICSAEFVDCILEKVLRLTPEHPPVNNLIDRGFCYSDGLYYYKEAFGVDFSTDVRKILKIFDLNDGVSFVVFSDIYTENGVSIPEYSYAVLQNGSEGYSLLRLGMGLKLPGEKTVSSYAVSQPEQENPEDTVSDTKPKDSALCMMILLTVISLGAVAAFIGAVIIIKSR